MNEGYPCFINRVMQERCTHAVRNQNGDCVSSVRFKFQTDCSSAFQLFCQNEFYLKNLNFLPGDLVPGLAVIIAKVSDF